MCREIFTQSIFNKSMVESNNRCKHVFRVDEHVKNKSVRISCCWRKTFGDKDSCIWHIDSDEIEKSVEDLQKSRDSIDCNDRSSPDNQVIDGAQLSGIKIKNKLSFSGYSLHKVDFSRSNLLNTNLSGADLRYSNLSEADLRWADLSNATLYGANLSGANLRGANLSGANLWKSNLSGVDLRECDLSGILLGETDISGGNMQNTDFRDIDFHNLTVAPRVDLSNTILDNCNLANSDLQNANLSGAELHDADLSGANLQDADLSDANLNKADLSEANLQGVDLTGANLIDTDLSGASLERCILTGVIMHRTALDRVSVDGTTSCKILYEGYNNNRLIQYPIIRQIFSTRPRWFPGVGRSKFSSEGWGLTAQSYHKMKKVFKENGLIAKARKQHLRERGARRCEILSEARGRGYGLGLRRRRNLKIFGMSDYIGWLQSYVSWQLTGYGVDLRRIFRNIGIVFGLSTVTYLFLTNFTPDTILTDEYTSTIEILYYSVVTFTTTPPEMPENDLIKIIVMAEAFLGTLLLVFLGYVLGTRGDF